MAMWRWASRPQKSGAQRFSLRLPSLPGESRWKSPQIFSQMLPVVGLAKAFGKQPPMFREIRRKSSINMNFEGLLRQKTEVCGHQPAWGPPVNARMFKVGSKAKITSPNPRRALNQVDATAGAGDVRDLRSFGHRLSSKKEENGHRPK